MDEDSVVFRRIPKFADDYRRFPKKPKMFRTYIIHISESRVQSPESRVQSPESRVQSPESSPESSPGFRLCRTIPAYSRSLSIVIISYGLPATICLYCHVLQLCYGNKESLKTVSGVNKSRLRICLFKFPTHEKCVPCLFNDISFAHC